MAVVPMPQTAAFLAILALLAAPGPTNALFALAGAQRGLSGAARLLPLAPGAYGVVVLPLSFAGTALFARWPEASGALRLLAALWLLILAARLWRHAGSAEPGRSVGARQVVVTTLLNPKAPLIALVLLPRPADPLFPGALALLALAALLAPAAWTIAGTLAAQGRTGPTRTATLSRLASGWLTLVAAGLISSLLPAAAAAV